MRFDERDVETEPRSNQEGALAAKRPEQFVEVSILTTAGFFPGEGFNRVPAHQKIEVELAKAKNELKIKDTAGWIATVTGPSGKRVIDPTKTYLENGLSGEVEIDWGPSEGGGGYAPGGSKGSLRE